MARKRSDTSKSVESPTADDLKLINGVGPAVESRLHGVGIFTFAQLTALSPADIAASVADLTGLTAERIIKQDWIGQARQLAAKATLTESMSIPVVEQIEAVEDEDITEAYTDMPVSTEVEAIEPVVLVRAGPAAPIIAEAALAVPLHFY